MMKSRLFSSESRLSDLITAHPSLLTLLIRLGISLGMRRDQVAKAIRETAHGKAEFWLDTGHSIHSERPRLFVREILYFLDHPDAGDSPNGTVVSTPPKAAYSLATR
jgi:hypothetical protein